jgi:hypothetical protein
MKWTLTKGCHAFRPNYLAPALVLGQSHGSDGNKDCNVSGRNDTNCHGYLAFAANVAAAFNTVIPWLKRSRKRSIKENISPLGECSFHE